MAAKCIDLGFVTDDHLRSVLEDYYRQGQLALDAGSYLGTIVACGAVVEGILTWVLLQDENRAKGSKKAFKRNGQVQPLQKWHLSSLIDVSVELGLVGPTAQKASWALKDFRNFVHPYNLLNQSARPDEALANSAASALSEIVRSLRGRLSPARLQRKD